MSARRLKILQVATAEVAGGAERSARNLFAQFDACGHDSWLAIGHRSESDAAQRITQIPNAASRNALVRAADRLIARADRDAGAMPGLGRAARALRRIAEPARALRRSLGHEDFAFPGTRDLLQLPPWQPDLVHCHNLHGGYFDLRELPRISAQVPTILNLRDAWLFSGHCAYGLGCERWRTGCGACPDLGIYPAIARDATAHNWRRKRAIYAASRVYVTAPSHWLLDQVAASMLAPAVIESRVIANGVDTRVFTPGDRHAAREQLQLDPHAAVVMLAANGIRRNAWKDYATLLGAVERLGAQWQGAPLLVLAVGEDGAEQRIGNAVLRFVPFVREPAILARYFQASDVYLHAARVESFGNVLLEARACGIAAVSTAVGGIVEHLPSLDCVWRAPGVPGVSRERAVGVLTAPGDADALAGAALLLLHDADLRGALSRAAIAHVAVHDALPIQARRFIDWYREILDRRAVEPYA